MSADSSHVAENSGVQKKKSHKKTNNKTNETLTSEDNSETDTNRTPTVGDPSPSALSVTGTSTPNPSSITSESGGAGGLAPVGIIHTSVGIAGDSTDSRASLPNQVVADAALTNGLLLDNGLGNNNAENVAQLPDVPALPSFPSFPSIPGLNLPDGEGPAASAPAAAPPGPGLPNASEGAKKGGRSAIVITQPLLNHFSSPLPFLNLVWDPNPRNQRRNTMEDEKNATNPNPGNALADGVLSPRANADAGMAGLGVGVGVAGTGTPRVNLGVGLGAGSVNGTPRNATSPRPQLQEQQQQLALMQEQLVQLQQLRDAPATPEMEQYAPQVEAQIQQVEQQMQAHMLQMQQIQAAEDKKEVERLEAQQKARGAMDSSGCCTVM